MSTPTRRKRSPCCASIAPSARTGIGSPDPAQEITDAQQVLPFFPNLVSTTSATTLTPDGTLSLNYIGFIAPIVRAIQALDHEMANLASTVAAFAQSFVSDSIMANNELCVGSTCVTSQQFQAMVAAANQSNNSSPPPPSSSNGTTTPNTPPIIHFNGENPAHIHAGDTYNDLGATPASRPHPRHPHLPQRCTGQRDPNRHDPSRNRHHSIRRQRPSRPHRHVHKNRHRRTSPLDPFEFLRTSKRGASNLHPIKSPGFDRNLLLDQHSCAQRIRKRDHDAAMKTPA